MKNEGYTLIELLVVIAIIAILSVFSFASFTSYSQDQILNKAAGEIQTYLRLAQSNATSSTLCNNLGATSWSLKFTNSTTIELHCSNPADFLSKTYTLENARISSISSCTVGTARINYAVGNGGVTFSDGTNPCIGNPESLTITVQNISNTTLTKNVTVSKGGAINVQ